MTTEETLIKRVKIAVVAGMVLLFSLVVVAGVLGAIRIRNDNMERSLSNQIFLLDQQIYVYGNQISHFQTQAFREEFALKYLGWGRPGQVVFV